VAASRYTLSGRAAALPKLELKEGDIMDVDTSVL
jgi:hypothetical protein